MIRKLAAVIAALGTASAAAAQGEIRIERRVSSLIYAREFRGDYRQHPQAMQILRADLEPRGLLEQAVIGIYPDDPDSVGMPNVRWELAVALATRRSAETEAAFRARSLGAFSQLGADRLRIIESETVSVMDSTTRRSMADGLRILRWLPTSGYVQSGPTRIEYLGLEPDPDLPIRIVVPVSGRTWARPGCTRRGSMRTALFLPLLFWSTQALASDIRRAEPGARPPPARIEDLAWLAGRWEGQGLGGRSYETISPPLGGQMVGHFQQISGTRGAVYFDGVTMLRTESGGLRAVVRVGREGQEEEVEFTFRRVEN